MEEEEKIGVKIVISDRAYKLSIRPSEEENLRIAAKRVNEKVQYYRDRFKNTDIQDALSMSLLQFALKCIEAEQNKDLDSLVGELNVLDKQLEEYLLEGNN